MPEPWPPTPNNAVACARWAKLLALSDREERKPWLRFERAWRYLRNPEVVAVYAMVLDWNGRYREAVEQALGP
ncbi:MAG: hypothetical protein Q9O62_09605 [Ardenticatenia bacterium]|nr:hypothetical protein [Ardenticatenia bacterium]